MERLTIKAPSGLIHLGDNEADTINRAIKKLSDYEDLEEQGLLLRLPFPLGTKQLYWADVDDWDVYVLDATDFCLQKMDISGRILYTIDNYDFHEDDFGKILFLKQEEAEAALEKMKGGAE